jgi:hypothetical protein
VASARWVAKTLQYPTDPPLAGPAWPWTLTLRPILLFAGGVAAVLGIQLVRRRRNAAARAAQGPDRESTAEAQALSR